MTDTARTTTEALVGWLSLLAGVGAGLTAGVFLAFSAFVMTGLGRAPVAVGVRAMQEINRAAPTPVFMITLFGPAVLALGIAVAAIAAHTAGRSLVVVGALAYLVAVVVTVTFHVPRNEALALVDPSGPAAAEVWRRYLIDWTRLNHVRTVSAVVGCVLLLLSRGAT